MTGAAGPDATAVGQQDAPSPLPFPPVRRSHILHCSYDDWYPRYRPLTPKARLIPLNDAFLTYLRADGIYLPPDPKRSTANDDDSGVYSDSDEGLHDQEDGDGDGDDVLAGWHDIHDRVCETIDELGGKVTPKLNWSAPQDATWMSATNDMKCQTANDVYLLLKSSDFITHDLDHAFDDTIDDGGKPDGASGSSQAELQHVLVLRKYFNMNPSVEFRVFVRDRTIVCLCQRDLNHFDFLFSLREPLLRLISDFFAKHLQHTFPDPNFVFDVYVPAPHDRVWLIDINPFALRTDPLLFSWREILDLRPASTAEQPSVTSEGNAHSESDSDADEDIFVPEFRLINKDDPEAYNFTSQKYSAHKMPKDVIDASRSGPGGMSEFLGTWQEMLEKNIREDQEYESSADERDDA
ncbi:hypothetical protein KEM52_002740 [Ascosphaera acerosa]|nr:hypothetical protein KEM52_002740 [Ascosphaera acerosa]